MLIFIRIVLIWWLLMVVFRFIDRYIAERRASTEVKGADTADRADADLDSIDQYAGAIEDADFEEIENR